VVDYLAEMLRTLRNYDYSQKYTTHFELLPDISTRDRDGINKTFSGLLKLLYPDGEATPDQMEELLVFAMEGRKRVKDQLMRIDSTYAAVQFGYRPRGSSDVRWVKTLEEKTYPQHYYRFAGSEAETENGAGGAAVLQNNAAASSPPVSASSTAEEQLQESHLVFEENQRGVSYDKLFGPYLAGAKRIVVTDPYIRLFYQAKNLMEFIETVARTNSEGDEVAVHLITSPDEYDPQKQTEFLEKIQEAAGQAGVVFTWEYGPEALHARHIVTDTGWKILLDRGLDIFQRYEMNDVFSIANRLQEQRAVKQFEVTYLRIG
jgi:ATP-dependent Lon protease